jgi:CheY-like chemotaxis protein
MPNVVVIDDDEDIRESLRCILEDAGYTVDECANAPAAGTLLTHMLPAVVLLDQIMPGMTGMQFLRATPQIHTTHRFALLTALHMDLSPEDDALRTALHIPVIRKPFSIDTLLRSVQTLDRALAGEHP